MKRQTEAKPMLRFALPLCVLALLLALPAQAGIFLEAQSYVQGPIQGDATPPPGEAGTIAITNISHGSAYSLDPLTGLPDGRSRVPQLLELGKLFDSSTVPLLRALGDEEVFERFRLTIYDPSNQFILMRITLRDARVLAHSNEARDSSPIEESWEVAYQRIEWTYESSTASYEDMVSTWPGGGGSSAPPALAPSPFEFELPAGELATVEVFDLERRLVCRVFDGIASDGERVRWDGRDDMGQRVAPGMYSAEVVTPAGRTVRKMAVGGD